MTIENVLEKLLQRGEPEPLQVKRQEEALNGFVATLDGHLAAREWVSGRTTTIADLSLAAPLSIAEQAKFPLDRFVHVMR